MAESPLPDEDRKREFVHSMFAGIAHRYDLLNSLLSARFDRRWRRFTAKACGLQDGMRALDICSGTGDLAFALSDNCPGATVIASDFVHEMLTIGASKSRRRGRGSYAPVLGDALDLPFADAEFDVVTVAFGIRNVANLKQGIAEMARVTRPGGRAVILEFTEPRSPVLRRAYMLYFTRVLPKLGNAISGSGHDAYSYLPASVLSFPAPDELATMMRECGLVNVRYHLKTGGIVAVHIGERASAAAADRRAA